MVLDLRNFKKFSIDSKTNITTMSAGTLLGEAYYLLWKQANLTIPGGSCHTVGIGRFFLVQY